MFPLILKTVAVGQLAFAHQVIILNYIVILSLLKYSIVFLIKFLGKPANKNFLVTRFTSKLKSSAMLLALCNSPVMARSLYLV